MTTQVAGGSSQKSDTEPEPGLPDPIRKAAEGGSLDAREERDALDWLLGATKPLEYTVPVQYDTPDGQREIRFRIRQLDGSTIEAIDAANRKGDGPFAKLDVQGFNAELATEATLWLETDTRKVEIRSDEFMGGMPAPALAMALRFKYQPGILEGLAEKIREASAYSNDRIGNAQRVLVEAGKAS
jgi:hypothetical protein